MIYNNSSSHRDAVGDSAEDMFTFCFRLVFLEDREWSDTPGDRSDEGGCTPAGPRGPPTTTALFPTQLTAA